ARVPPQGAARRGRTIMTRRLEAAAVEAFTAELRHNVPLILAALDASEQHPIDPVPAQEAYRLIHALKGAASMVGLAALSHLLNLAEERLERSVDAGTPLPADSVTLLRASMGRFADYVDAALARRPIDDIAARLARTLRTDESADVPDSALRE